MNSPRLRFLSFAALAALLATTARATSFNLTTASTTAQTLGSGAGQTGVVSSTGSLTVSGAVAVTVTGNNTTLTNDGTISQTSGDRAIRVNTNNLSFTVTNNASGLIKSAGDDAIQINKANDSFLINNYGTLWASAGGQALDINAVTTGSNTVNNFTGGLIKAETADAVRPGVNGFVYNDGSILSTTTFPHTDTNDGIDAQSNTGITIVNAAAIGGETVGTALIEGTHHGITGGNAVADASGNPTVNNGAFTMTVTNNAGGTIRGLGGSGINIDGLNANEVITITNHGTITGTSTTADADGVDVDGVVHLTNYGTIQSLTAHNETSEGVTVGGGTITNDGGTIEGSVSTDERNTPGSTSVGRGITIAGIDKYTDAGGTDYNVAARAPYVATTITNQNGGLIKGDTDSAIAFTSALSSGFTHTINNDATSTLQGGGTTVAAIVTAADKVNINNSGTIDGSSSGKAIQGGSGGINVQITGPSAVVHGGMFGAAGADNLLTISPGTAATFSYNGAIANFRTTEIATGTFAFDGQLTFNLNGLTAGDIAGYDQLLVDSGAALSLGANSRIDFVVGGSYVPAVGDSFKLFDLVDGSSAINGTFSNLIDGGTLVVNGISFIANYEGGTGNDLVLTVTSTAVPEPATWAALAGLGALGFACWRRRAQRG